MPIRLFCLYLHRIRYSDALKHLKIYFMVSYESDFKKAFDVLAKCYASLACDVSLSEDDVLYACSLRRLCSDFCSAYQNSSLL